MTAEPMSGGLQGAVIGVDVGGTFTDVVLSAPGISPALEKLLTTADDPSLAVLEGVRRVLATAEIDGRDVVRVVHGTTLATNVILERRGASVVTVTTAGFADVLRLGHSTRVEEDRYRLDFVPEQSPLSTMPIVEVDERMNAAGQPLTPLTVDATQRLVAELTARQPDAIAICLLHSWANPTHEQQLADAVRAALPETYVAASSEVWPELREHDRSMTTALSAYVGPVMAGYLRRLLDGLAATSVAGDLWVMDSAGGVVAPRVAIQRPVATIESGGAAGLRAAATIATSTTGGTALSFDMGGTTAKLGIIRDGEPGITHQFQVGGKGSYGYARPGSGLPVNTPVVDLAEIGAGGGSIAWVDQAGALHVGPRSAGSRPGPASYRRGGTDPTVTDANLALGILGDGPLTDDVSLSRDAALDAIDRAIATPLGIDVVEAASAIRAIAVAHMATAIRLVTVQRGVDPRELPLIAFGGAAAMHATALAETFGIDRIVVPWGAGLASAFGLASARPAADRVRTRPLPATDDAAEHAVDILRELAVDAGREVAGIHADPPSTVDIEVTAHVALSVDMRFVGQAHTLTVAAGQIDDVDSAHWMRAVRERFIADYRDTYGITLDAPSELVTFRARVVQRSDGDPTDAGWSMPATTSTGSERPIADTADAKPASRRDVSLDRHTDWETVDVWDWRELSGDWQRTGPVIVAGLGTTVLVPTTWTVGLLPAGHLELRN